jgi:hypothetical protein
MEYGFLTFQLIFKGDFMDSTTLIIIACVIAFVVIPSFRDRTMPVKKLLIGPAVFLYLFYQSLGEDFPLFAVSYALIIVGGILGVAIGYYLRIPTKITADQAQRIITIKGGFFTLYTFLVIFAVHFVVGYLKSTHPQFFLHASVSNQFLLMLLALTSCLTVGSNSCLFLKFLAYKNEESPA